MKTAFLAMALLAAVPVSAAAAPVTLFNAVVTADGAAAPPPGATASLFGPAGFGGGLLPGSAIPVEVPDPGTITIRVMDLGAVGDVFEVLLDEVSAGLSAAAAIGGAVNSAGTFSLPVGAGLHQVGVWDPVLTYLGSTSPFGGAVPFDFTSTDLLLTITFDAAPVPEPMSLALLGAALGCAAALRRRA